MRGFNNYCTVSGFPSKTDGVGLARLGSGCRNACGAADVLTNIRLVANISGLTRDSGGIGESGKALVEIGRVLGNL